MTLRICVATITIALLAGCGSQEKREDAIRVQPPEKKKLSPAESKREYAMAYERGLAVVQRRDYAVALGYFERAVELDPSSIEAHFALGACYEQTGDPVRAIRQYRQILAIRPNDADVYANLGTSYVKLYQREHNKVWLSMARDAWEHSLALRPGQSDVRNYLASIDAAPRRADPVK